MISARVCAVILACVFAAALIGCQDSTSPVPATATVAEIRTNVPDPTATALQPPTPAPPPATATPEPTPAITAPSPTAIAPTNTVAPAAVPATRTPDPVPSSPTLAQVPVTDGPVRATVMDSRDHFPSQLYIDDVEPDGYNTVPPTSGRHWGAWSDCGFYNYPLPDELLVHNLEHGNIIVSYNLNDESQIAALRDAVDAIPLAAEYAIVRRYHAIPEGMVAVTTWGVLDRMMGVDPDRIARFFREFPGNTGPEFPNGLPCTTGVRMTDSSGG